MLLAAAGAAQAGTVSFNSVTGVATFADDTAGAGGQVNTLTVTRGTGGNRDKFTFADTSSTITAGSGWAAACTGGGTNTVVCDAGANSDAANATFNVTLDPAGGANNDSFAFGSGTTNRLTATGGGGNDTITAAVGTFDDSLDGGAGTDTLTGNAGNDTFPQGSAPDGNDTLNGGADSDTVDYANRTSAVSVTLDGTANDGDVATTENDNVAADFETVNGSSVTTPCAARWRALSLRP